MLTIQESSTRPIVGLPMATSFNETIAMDLKFYHGKILLHLIDHCTRLSASTVIPDKNPDTVIKAIFKIWISVYGSAEKFLTDNGGEFANDDFVQLCETFGIIVKTTAGEAPWSNGLVERHNLILSDMLNKVLDDKNCSLDLAVSWCINAKNALTNFHGFSPYQLFIGTNPKSPSTHNAKTPALTSIPTNKIVIKNLEAIHRAREAFIANENSEKLRRTLSHNIRITGYIKYLTGDSVNFKRMDSDEWHGPAKVLGQDGQQVLVKNGSRYIRVYPCRLQLINEPKTIIPIRNNIAKVKENHSDNNHLHQQHTFPNSDLSDSDSFDTSSDSEYEDTPDQVLAPKPPSNTKQ